MNFESSKLIFRKIKSRSISIGKVCEVGVYLPETSNIIDFINSGHTALLVEPDPDSIKAIKSYFKEYNNIKLYPKAIYKHSGSLVLSKAGPSTFVADLPHSPALVNDQHVISDENSLVVDCDLFSNIDDGDIDLLSIDTEGSEWYVLSTMISRPKIISVETHGKFYTNPFLDRITHWMEQENYDIWYKDKSDTVFYKRGIFEPKLLDKLTLKVTNLYLWLRRNKRHIGLR